MVSERWITLRILQETEAKPLLKKPLGRNCEKDHARLFFHPGKPGKASPPLWAQHLDIPPALVKVVPGQEEKTPSKDFLPDGHIGGDLLEAGEAVGEQTDQHQGYTPPQVNASRRKVP